MAVAEAVGVRVGGPAGASPPSLSPAPTRDRPSPDARREAPLGGGRGDWRRQKCLPSSRA